jgi:hypothetical protein
LNFAPSSSATNTKEKDARLTEICNGFYRSISEQGGRRSFKLVFQFSVLTPESSSRRIMICWWTADTKYDLDLRGLSREALNFFLKLVL